MHIVVSVGKVTIGLLTSIGVSLVITFSVLILLNYQSVVNSEEIGVLTHLINSPILVINLIMGTLLCWIISFSLT